MTGKPSASALPRVAEPAFSPDDDVGDAGIAQVQRMGASLAAVADDGDALAADDRQIAVAVMERGQRIR
jgi:hypothetical protein